MSDEAAKKLNALAEPKGYGVTVTSTLGSTEPMSWFDVHPLDRPDDGNPFATEAEARAYIEGLHAGE